MRHLRALHALALLGITASTTVIVGLLVLTGQVDRQQRQREIMLVSSQLDTTLAGALAGTAAYARSNEAIRRLDHARDAKWGHDTYVTPANSSTRTYTFDHDDRMISGPNLPLKDASGALGFERQLPTQLNYLRNLSTYQVTSPKIDLTAGVIDTLKFENTFFLVMAAAFSPETPDVKLIHDKPPLLVVVIPWPEVLRLALAGDGIDKVSVIDSARAAGGTSVPIKDAVGKVVGAVVWTFTTPGADLMAVMVIPLLALLSLFLIVVAFAYRQGIVSARELLASEARAQDIACHDHLTGLANRRLFMQELANAFVRGKEGKAKPALVLVDLDHFKTINDTFGHQCGDELIREAGQRLRSVCGPDDLCARLGGDEFVIMMRSCERAEAVQMARSALRALSGTVRLSLISIEIAGSAGVSLFSGQANEEQLMREADLALYDAKENGRGTVQLFERETEPDNVHCSLHNSERASLLTAT